MHAQSDDTELNVNLNNQITDFSPEKLETIHGPIRINQFSMEEFQSLGIFTTNEILRIIDYRQKHGSFIHMLELQRLEIDIETLREINIRLDFRLSTKQSVSNMLHLLVHGNNKHQLILGTQSESNLFQLNPFSYFPAYYLKYAFHIPQIGKIGFSFQTDAQEKGIDFFTMSLHIKQLNALQNITLGRYYLSNNQGLVVAAPFPVGRRYALESWSHGIQENISHSGWNEDNGYWGISTEYKHRKSKTALSIGYHKFDSEIHDSGYAFLRQIFGGNHVTDLELSRKNNNAIFQTAISNCHLSKWSTFFLGGYFYQTKIPKFRKSRHQKNTFTLLETSFTTQAFLRGRIIANAAINDELNWALYVSGLWSLSKEVSFGVRYQQMQKDYYSPELSVFKYDELNRRIMDAGFDWILNAKNSLLLRTGSSSPIQPFLNEKITKPEKYVGMVWEHQFNKKDRVGLRIQQTERVHKINQDISLNAHISPLMNLNIQWQCLLRREENNPNWGNLNSIKIQYIIAKIAKLGFYFGQFRGNENTLYTTIPSFTNRIQLGLFTDNGVFYSLQSNFEINSHFKLQIMASQIKKIEPSLPFAQPNHRIFVQLILQ